MNFPSNYVIEKKGLRHGVLFGAVITIIGVWIRVGVAQSFNWVLVGQAIASLGYI